MAALTRAIRAWIGVVVPPSTHSDSAMVEAARDLFGIYGVRLDVCGRRELQGRHQEDLFVDLCNEDITSEQWALFSDRGQATTADICLYFVRSTVDAYNGCAAHPPDLPGAVVVADAGIWTVAHEIGHVLRLEHVDDDRFLMTGNGTANITEPRPFLSQPDLDRIAQSPLAVLI